MVFDELLIVVVSYFSEFCVVIRKEFSFIIFSKFDPKYADLRTSSIYTLH